MSDNKLKYFEVTTTAYVRANNQQDAIRIALSRSKTTRSLPGAEVLARVSNVVRRRAADARSMAAEINEA